MLIQMRGEDAGKMVHKQEQMASEKTAIMTVSCKKEPIQFNYLLEEQPLRRVEEYKYLGLVFNSKLN